MQYHNRQLMYHMHFTAAEIALMSDQEWANEIAILADIRAKQAKLNPFSFGQ